MQASCSRYVVRTSSCALRTDCSSHTVVHAVKLLAKVIGRVDLKSVSTCPALHCALCIHRGEFTFTAYSTVRTHAATLYFCFDREDGVWRFGQRMRNCVYLMTFHTHIQVVYWRAFTHIETHQHFTFVQGDALIPAWE